MWGYIRAFACLLAAVLLATVSDGRFKPLWHMMEGGANGTASPAPALSGDRAERAGGRSGRPYVAKPQGVVSMRVGMQQFQQRRY